MQQRHFEEADVRNLHIRYISQLVLYQLMIFIQIALIIATIVKFSQKVKSKKLSEQQARTNNRIQVLFTTVLSTGTIIFLLVEWYGIADFLYDFAAWDNYCNIAAILGNLSILTYFLSLYLFYLYRLYATFDKSAIQLSPCTVKTLLVITFGIYFVMVVLVLILQEGAVAHTPFAWSMKKEDYKWIVICEGEFSIGIDARLRWALEGIVVIGNMYYGWIFYKKLYDLFKFISQQTAKNIQVDTQSQGILKLMNKQTTLVMISTISTSIFWTVTNVLHYFGSYWQVLVYLDISINCLCLFLMFAWNDKLYRKLCKPCIVLNELCCSRCIKTEKIRELEREIELNQSKTKTTTTPKENNLHFHVYYEEETGSKPNEQKSEISGPTQPV